MTVVLLAIRQGIRGMDARGVSKMETARTLEVSRNAVVKCADMEDRSSAPRSRRDGPTLGRAGFPRRHSGSSCLHVAVDDFSRVVYDELLPDERKGTCAAFMSRRLLFFAESVNRLLVQERQYGRTWDSEAGRVSALPAFIDRHDWKRPHSACGAFLPCRASSA